MEMTWAARTCWQWLLRGLCLACFGMGLAGAQAILEPPFGLRWGDFPEKLISWASKRSLDINIFLPGDQFGLRVLKIGPREGFLPDSPAAAVEGKFLNGGLFEMTVHYIDPQASADVMAKRFDDLRRQIVSQQGPLLTNQQRRAVADQFVTRTQSFHREPIKGVFLLLAWTEVEDLLRQTKEAKFSLIYRNDNYRDALRKNASGE